MAEKSIYLISIPHAQHDFLTRYAETNGRKVTDLIEAALESAILDAARNSMSLTEAASFSREPISCAESPF